MTASTILESPFKTSRDLDVTVTTACSLEDDAAAIAMLLVITPLDATLTAIDPWNVNRVAFLED